MTVIYTVGVYDLFHVGHLQILQKARSLGDFLLVGVYSDESCQKYKRTPIIPFEQRLEIIQDLHCVDEAFLAPIQQDELFYRENKIDCHCQGEDVLDHFDIPKALGIFQVLGRNPHVSSTEIIARIQSKKHLSVNSKAETLPSGSSLGK